MSKPRNEKAHNAVVKARTALLISQPFFGCLALQLELVESSDKNFCDTMAVDGVHEWYWPEFVLSLTEEELLGVKAHEVLHCAFKHMTRRGHRNPTIWNMAGDYIINSDLKKAGFKLPGPPLPWDPKNAKKYEGVKGHLCDPKFDGMSTEEVYERLKQDCPTLGAILCGEGGEGVGGLPDIGSCGKVLDAGKPGDQATAEQVSRDWEEAVRQAVNVAKANGAGTVPGFLARLIDQLSKPKMDWRERTRRFIDQSMKKDYSWARPNRRMQAHGLTFPGQIPDGVHHLIFAVDDSGSVGDDMLQKMLSEVGGALDAGAADRVTVIYADTRVHKVDEFVQGDLVIGKLSDGGGGTDFRDTFNWIEKNEPDAAAIIYLTDMMTCDFGHDVGIPTLWAAFCPAQVLAQYKPPHGEIVEVDTE